MSCLYLSWVLDVSQQNLCSLRPSFKVKAFVTTADVFGLSAATEKATYKASEHLTRWEDRLFNNKQSDTRYG